MTPARFRKLALSMPGAVEGEHHGHPDFRANGHVFASLHPDGRRAMLKVPLAEQARLVQSPGETFAAANGAWGRAGCTMVVLQDVAAEQLEGPITLAWQEAIARAPARVRAPRAKTAAATARRKAQPNRRS